MAREPRRVRVGHTGLSRRGRGVAALLHAGDDSALYGLSAARVWDMAEHDGDGPIHVAVRNRSGGLAQVAGVVIHRPRNLRDDEVVLHRGLRVTTPERTLLDLLPSSSEAEITRMLEQMVIRLGRSPDDLHAWAAGLGRVAGKHKLLRALDHVVGPAVIRSQLEALFRTVCQEGGLPLPQTNVRVGRWELDVVWQEQRVAVELDSWRFHGGQWAFHRDRRKGLAVSRSGYELIRLSWPQLKRDQPEVIATLTLALRRGDARRLARAAGFDVG